MLQYISLISKRKKNAVKLTVDEETRIDQLELQLPYETILLFRSLADAYLEMDKEFVAQQEALAAQEKAQQSQSQYVPLYCETIRVID
jgi:hypothetical protein